MATSRLAAALASLASLSMATTAPALAAPDRAVPAGPGLEQPARIGAAPAAPPTAPAVPAIGSDADASRKDGWRFDIGGRLQFHYDDFRGLYSNDGNPASVGYLRRGRFELGARRGDFVFGLDLEPQEAGPAWLNKLYVTYRGFKPTDITIGRFKPDFGLEQAISSKWTTTTERSAIWELAPDATDYEAAVGIEVRTHGDRHHGSAAVIRKREHTAQVARVAYAPWLDEQRVVHLGLGYSREDIERSNGRVRSRLGIYGVTESQIGERTTLAGAWSDRFDSDQAAVAELAWRQGPYSAQAEYLYRRLGGVDAVPTRIARGRYLQLAWTVTGEARPYDIDGARFGAIRPSRSGLGAWEVFARRDWLTVTGDGRSIGDGSGRASARVDALGFNWYASRYLRLSAALTRSRVVGVETESGDRRGRGLTLRAQVAF